MSDELTTHTVGIIMNGVTGRMGTNQHLLRSIVPIMKQGGVKISEDEVIMPRPVLVGRNPVKLQKLSERTGIEEWTTDLDAVLEEDDYHIYFDAQRTDLRFGSVKKAVSAGKHIYCEKPTAVTTEEAVKLHHIAEEGGVKHGVVQDKLWLPGLMQLKQLKQQDFFGKILSVKADFGYWVFEGDTIAAQRPSWNYREEDGGGLILDMFCHWRYILDNIFGEVKSVSCLGTTHIDKRYEEDGTPYEATADDAAYAIFELEDDIVAQFNSSWTTRVRRDDLVTFQVDGTRGSAVAGLREVWIQPHSATPKPVWNPDVDSDHNFYDDWIKMPKQQEFDNAFKIQWELFLRHVVKDDPFRWNLLEAAKGVQLAEIGYEASEQRAWIEVPELG
ncbi:Gfo/Idh/MocA family protein [Fodinibius sp.]|uniref:Gfo/Idh/MocA family protein n=1 Tax=Fodinibius sp. TaxID=1872440 RepID=UPI003561D600